MSVRTSQLSCQAIPAGCCLSSWCYGVYMKETLARKSMQVLASCSVTRPASSSHMGTCCYPGSHMGTCQRRGYCIWVCLFVCLSVCLFVRTELLCFSPQPLVGLRQFSPSVRLLVQNVLMIIITSWVTWCGSHIGKTEKNTLDLYISETVPRKK